MKNSNNIYTKSYFIKRLIEFGFIVTRLVDKYDAEDIRYWTVLVQNRAGQKTIITCVKTFTEFYFRINGPNDANIKLETLSMNIVQETIDRLFKGVDILKITLEP